ncbi:MAG: hypothetical protein ACPG7V_03290, partial [Flavobacteriaceae bacterium]
PKDPNPAINSLSAYCQDINLKRIAKQVIEKTIYFTFSVYSNLLILQHIFKLFLNKYARCGVLIFVLQYFNQISSKFYKLRWELRKEK